MKIGIIGGGSLGLMWTARLCLAGYKPLLIVRSNEQRLLIEQEGLYYIEHGITHVIHPTVQSIDQFEGDLPDWNILTVKQNQIDGVLPFLYTHLNKASLLFTLQNGLGHAERLSQVIDQDRLVIGVTTDGALRHTLNRIERTGHGDTWFGQAGRVNPPSSLEEEFNQLDKNGIQLYWDRDINHRIWRKCLINSVINPLTALLQVRNGELLQSMHIQNMMKDLLDEGKIVAKSEGFHFSDELMQEIEDICRITSNNYSSMLQDLLAERETEIDYINGYILKRAEYHQVSTPTHQLLVQLIRAKEEIHSIRGKHH